MTKSPVFSIIIPYKEKTSYLEECLKGLQNQTLMDFEIILLPDKKGKNHIHIAKARIIATGEKGPAEKRDMGVAKAKGKILAFIDDDAYPSIDWLANSLPFFQDKNISAVCGPGITPPGDNIFQKAGGYVNSLWFGSGGAGTYRFIPMRRRYVDDYPSMNFLVRKTDFEKAGGFDTHFWPGEDTKLCHDIVYVLRKKILYDPKVLVYHHRKPLFLPHLKQIARFAIHRGHFARVLPTTSFRIGYLIPTLFIIYLISGLFILSFISKAASLYVAVVLLYVLLILGNGIYVTIKSRSIFVGGYTVIGIFLTHIIYGLLFPIGFFKKTLKQ